MDIEIPKASSSTSSCKKKKVVKFCVNGKEYQVSNKGDCTPETKLVDYVRLNIGLTGTKFMCREGGCGACVVAATVPNAKTGIPSVKAVNSCLVPIFSCDGWTISTVEAIGSVKKGMHHIQQRLMEFSGSQCGFCSPGMVMTMFSLQQSKSAVTVEDVENSLDGNICRCTGYRPILDAFKSLAADAPLDILNKCKDIEDVGSCPKLGKLMVEDSCKSYPRISNEISIDFKSGRKWIIVSTLKSAYSELLKLKSSGKSYRIVAGNTAPGVYFVPRFPCYLDISGVAELSKYTIGNDKIILGSGVTLASAMQVFEIASKQRGFQYTMKMRTHLQRVANTPVRNIATLGGNLMLKHEHKDFPSDVFLLTAAVDAKLIIGIPMSGMPNEIVEISMVQFLEMDMTGKFIISIHLPAKKENHFFRSFKITKRYQNNHAYVNGAISMYLDPSEKHKIVGRPSIVYGGINPNFVHANNTEAFLTSQSLSDESTRKRAIEILDAEVIPDVVLGEASPAYRNGLAKSLLYKTFLGILEDRANEKVKSGADDIVRLISKGTQNFDIDDGTTPLYKPFVKLEAPYQVTGEAQYIDDIPFVINELHGAFVLTSVANAELDSIDATEALKIDGVFQLITAKDIPGINNYMIFGAFPGFQCDIEEIFLTDQIPAAGLAVGLILADTRQTALFAASKVVVTYKNVRKPNLSGREALKKEEMQGTLKDHIVSSYTSKRKSSEVPTRTIKGDHYVGPQYHFHMETQLCLCVPKEDSMDVYSGTQWMNHVQAMVAAALDKPNNYVNVYVKRIGGAFGAKGTKASYVATACAVAAHVTNRPVRVVLDLRSNMKMIGKRHPYINRYEVKVDDKGKIVELVADMFNNTGFATNDLDAFIGILYFQNVYVADGWSTRAGVLRTDAPANLQYRAIGSLSTVAFIEYIMEHIAFELKLDPLEVRVANFRQKGDLILASGLPKEEYPIPKMLKEMKLSSDYEKRKLAVFKFNKENRWRKRGISLCPSEFPVSYNDSNYSVFIAIYYVDGSIAVSSGGIEMGQGINTKIAQTVAHILEVSLDRVVIKASNNLIGSNSYYTAGSIGSELCCYAAMKAAMILKERLRPIKEELGSKATWEEIITAAYAKFLDLSASYRYGTNDGVKQYSTWAITVSEVEVDILTGEYRVIRVDLLNDVGKSLNPFIDIGQVEGCILQGVGVWTSEELISDETTGELLTNRTWNYTPPESKDVPTDMRITLLHEASNPFGVLRSKAIGEPPILGMVSVFFALKHAIDSARKDAGHTEWYKFDPPATPEHIWRYSLTSSDRFYV